MSEFTKGAVGVIEGVAEAATLGAAEASHDYCECYDGNCDDEDNDCECDGCACYNWLQTR